MQANITPFFHTLFLPLSVRFYANSSAEIRMKYGSVRMMPTESSKQTSWPSGNIGEQLRQQRLKNGWTLDQVSAQTRIPVRHLQTIEDGRGRELPGGFIGKSFVRQYAEAVGLDGEQALRDFVTLTGVNLDVAFEERKISPFTPESLQRFQAKQWKRIALIAASVVLIGAIIAYLLYKPSNEPAPAPSQNAPDDRAPAAATTSQPPLSEPPAIVPAATAPVSGGAPPSARPRVSGLSRSRTALPEPSPGSEERSAETNATATQPQTVPQSSPQLETAAPPAPAQTEPNP